MNLRSLSARAALAGATTALVAGGLVVATDTAANAAEVTGSYECTALGNPLGAFPLTVSVPLLPPTAPAGMPIDAGLLSADASLVVPSALLQLASIDGGTVDDFAMSIGSKAISAPLTVTEITDNGNGTSTVAASGGNAAFVTPKAGSYDVKLPSAFTFSGTSGGNPAPEVSCVTDAPATLGSIQLSKQASTMTAKAVKTSKGYKVTAHVANEYGSPTGKVTTKLGTKKYSGAIKNGKAVIKLPKSAKGKKLTLNYKGDGYTSPAKTTVKVPKK